MAVILAAAYLHDIGIHAAETKHDSTAARFQEAEGPPIARAIMEKLGAPEKMIAEVCDMIGHHHHPREEETLSFKVLYDADLIANMEENHKEKPADPEKINRIINDSFFTENGRKVAQERLLQS